MQPNSGSELAVRLSFVTLRGDPNFRSSRLRLSIRSLSNSRKQWGNQLVEPTLAVVLAGRRWQVGIQRHFGVLLLSASWISFAKAASRTSAPGLPTHLYRITPL